MSRAVRTRIAQPLEYDDSTPLSPYIAISLGIKGFATAVGSERMSRPRTIAETWPSPTIST